MGVKFMSQTYHVITPENFQYFALNLDLVPVVGAATEEVVSSLLITRQQYHTEKMDPEPIAAAGFADGGANVQAAGRNVYEAEDVLRCENHKIKGCSKDIEARCPPMQRDLDALYELFSYTSWHTHLLRGLRAEQYIQDVTSYELIVENETRWEKRVTMLVTQHCARRSRCPLCFLC